MDETEYIDVVLHRPQVHAVKPRKPMNWLRAILKMQRTGKPQRVFITRENMKFNKDGTARLSLPLPKEMQAQLNGLEAQGKKIRFRLPEGGLPIYLSDDAKEKIVSMERKKKR